jgi:NADPH2:quinone reductase
VHGEPLRVEEVEVPPPPSGEVWVDLAFAGVNPVDGYTAEGRVAPDGPLPRTLGSEASGTCEGRPVVVFGAGLGKTRDGLWATGANVPSSSVLGVPEGVGMEEASAAPVVGVTAWNVLQLAGVVEGDRVLVLGASGGAGLPIVSLAHALGARVAGQTGSHEKAAAVRAQGADEVVVTAADGLAEAVAEFEPTVAIDSLGSSFTQAALGCLVPGGRMVIFGTSAGPEGKIHLQGLYRNGLKVLGYAGLRLSDAEHRSALEAALDAMAKGLMRIPVDRSLPLGSVNEALDILRRRRSTGKLVLDLS